MAAAVADYASLETAGWKGEMGSAVHAEDAQGRFYKKMLSAFAERGEAVVYRFFYGDRLVATDLCINRDKTLFILKTTHDETEKGTSPAHLMRYEVVREGFHTGTIKRIEFYGPAKDWHLRWTDDTRRLFHVNVYRSRLLGAWHRRNRRGASDQAIERD